MNDHRILTTPEVIRDHIAHLPTGNDYVSLPTVRPADGGVERFGVLHQGSVSLLEVCGDSPATKRPGDHSVLRPFLVVDGRVQPLANVLRWERLAHWLPRFRWSAIDGAVTLEGTIFAPPGVKGFVYLLRLERHAGIGALQATIGWRGRWGDTLQTVFSSARVTASHRVHRDRWTGGPVFEVRPGPALLGWALLPSAPLDRCAWSVEDASEPESTSELLVPAGTPLGFRLERDTSLAPGDVVELALYVGVNREGDGARTTAIDLARHGHRRLLARTVDELATRSVSLPRLEGAERPRLEATANANLLFNRFFALGRCLDTEELACVTSRSPLYYVSAAFWARDSLLWSLPALLITEPAVGREVLRLCFTRHLRNAGVHALYLDGTVLYPGFELDELCAYVLGVDSYLAATGDTTLLAEEAVASGLSQIEETLQARRHPEVSLYETFLYPSDDPATYPYLTYDNALAARTLELLGDWLERGWWRPARAPSTPHRERAATVRRAVYERLVVDGPCGRMFAWSTDLETPPRHKIYDEPPGSLQLLAHYGLCTEDDPIFQATRRWIHSPHNPYCYGEATLAETGCPHAEHPFVMSLFNSLLSGRAPQAKEILLRAPLDGGLACESFDRETGQVRTGAAFATCAGFLAYALVRAFG
jgi:uncharacterized protein